MASLSRRSFLATGSIAVASGIAIPASSAQQKTFSQQKQNKKRSRRKRKPQLDSKKVQQFVLWAHSDLKKVQKLHEETPTLLNAAHDWGAGDWETALGAAAHTGGREIALFLLEKGVRIDIFAAAMLGKLEIVKAAIEAYPETINVKGPHGIPLIRHAEKGKEQAEPVLEYLKQIQKKIL